MTAQDQVPDARAHFRRAKRAALSLSLVAASWILFLIYEYGGSAYQRIPFWELRWAAFGVVLVAMFLALWFRVRRGTSKDTSVERSQ